VLGDQIRCSYSRGQLQGVRTGLLVLLCVLAT
jgi:hypothetical protein